MRRHFFSEKPIHKLLPHQMHVSAAPRTIVPPLKVLIIGLGGLGGHAVTYLRNNSKYKLDTYAIDTNAKDLANVPSSFQLLLGEAELRGLGTGIEPEISANLMQESLSELDDFIRLHGYQIIIGIAGAGGGTGSGALPVLANFCKENGLGFIPIITAPFEFEGRKKCDIAESLQGTMQKISPDIFIIRQQKLLKDYPKARFKDALDQSLFVIMQHTEKYLRKSTKKAYSRWTVGHAIKTFGALTLALYIGTGVGAVTWQYYKKNGALNTMLNAGGLPDRPLRVLLWPMDAWSFYKTKEKHQSVYDKFLDGPVPEQAGKATPALEPVISPIKACHAKAKSKFDSGVTTTMIEGNVEYARCLENSILKQSERIYPKAQWAEAKAQIQVQLKQIEEATNGFYYRLQNQNQWCKPSCGTMWYVTYSSPYHAILENIIIEMQNVERTNMAD